MLKELIRKNPDNPILITVPHAGNIYPDLFIKNLKINLCEVRRIEDYQSNKILDQIDEQMADIIIAQCSRAVVDLNRSRNAIDHSMFTQVFEHEPVSEKQMIKYGLGVFPNKIFGKTILKSPLPFSYAIHMLEHYYDPFHKSLNKQIMYLNNTFGFCYHIDLHTMPSKALLNFKKEPDIVLGDNFGKSCSIGLINYFQNVFQENGFTVEVNNPYAGGFITRNYGNPSKGVHTIQIEINRKIYMDENKLSLKNIKILQEIFAKIFNNLKLSEKIAAE
jgi:N-formylglutamate amidohydrolase